MKNIFKVLFTIAIALLLGIPCFSQTHYSDKIDIDNELFFQKLVSVQLDMQKDSVMNILGGPYKKAEIKTNNGDVYESISYRAYVYKKNYINSIIVYSCVFKNKTLIMIHEEELFSGDHYNGKLQGVDLWAISKNIDN